MPRHKKQHNCRDAILARGRSGDPGKSNSLRLGLRQERQQRQFESRRSAAQTLFPVLAHDGYIRPNSQPTKTGPDLSIESRLASILSKGLCQMFFNRMPVIYDDAMGRQWLEQSFGNWALELSLVLQSLPSEGRKRRGVENYCRSLFPALKKTDFL
jgi:hypothetical protein